MLSCVTVIMVIAGLLVVSVSLLLLCFLANQH